jgi:protein-S-isoprenylcysteine O-methyltransferase Ste14
VAALEDAAMSTVASSIASTTVGAPAWALRMRRLNNWLLHDAFGGPRPLKFSWIINFQKGGTFLFLGALMWLYAGRTPSATSTAAWIYLAMHGTYGLTWLLKDLTFPDPNWQVRITLGSSVYALIGLGLYWTFGWLLISGTSQPHYPLPDAAWFCLCLSLCTFGSVIMIAADAQKFYTLRVKRELITDGMFKYVRHPNYLGEMMIYGAFALMVWHRLPVLVLAWIWGGLFAVNMVMKEANMSQYPEWAAYRKSSWWLVPGLL